MQCRSRAEQQGVYMTVHLSGRNLNRVVETEGGRE